MGTQVVCLIASLQLKSVQKRVSLVLCSGEAMTNFRYVHRGLDATQVLEALSSKGLRQVGTRQCSLNKAMEDGRLVPNISVSKCTQDTANEAKGYI